MTSNRRPLLEAETTKPIIDIFRDVHRTFGFGYREHIYRLAIERDLRRLGLLVEREVGVIVYYRGEPLARQRLDMVVNSRVVVEIKATEQLHPTANAQLFSYLCSTDYEVGLLLHFGHKAEFQRVIFENRLKARRGRA
jgi:GxxExxY protein